MRSKLSAADNLGRTFHDRLGESNPLRLGRGLIDGQVKGIVAICGRLARLFFRWLLRRLYQLIQMTSYLNKCLVD